MIKISELQKKVTIMIVDDDDDNLKMLSLCFKSNDYRLLVAQDGESAINKIKLAKPNIILMDVVMPGIDGFDTCRKLKENNVTRDIPLIFMTSLNDSDSIIKGFEVGAIDYVSKPFNFEEIKIRVSNQLKIQEQANIIQEKAQELEVYNEELIALNEELEAGNEELFKEIEERRKAENSLAHINLELQKTMNELETMQGFLIQSEKMAALGNLVAGLAHEINTPIGVAITAASYLEEIAIEASNAGQNTLELERVQEVSNIIYSNMLKAGKLIRNFKLVSIDQAQEEKRSFYLKEYIDEVLLSLYPFTKKFSHQISIECDPSIKMTNYPGAFGQVLTNLVYNAFLHGFEAVTRGLIKIEVTQKEDNTIIGFKDNGVGMNQQVLCQLFDPFFTTKRNKGGSGLGMYIVYNLVTVQLHGSIKCESHLSEGTTYEIKIPNN